MPPLIYRATRLQLVHTRQGALRCWAFGKLAGEGPEVMVGQLRTSDLGHPPDAGLFRLWAGSYYQGQPVYEEDAVLQLRLEDVSRAREWLSSAIAGRAPHALAVGG
jgi:hypothetical protein